MDKVFSNLFSVEWWFTGTFFVILAFILPVVYRKILGLKGLFRDYKKKTILAELRKIKSIRRYDILIQKEIIRTYALLSIFSIVSVVFFYSYFLDPIVFNSIENDLSKLLDLKIDISINIFTISPRTIVFIVLSIPIYFFELIYLKQRNFLHRLLRYSFRLKKKTYFPKKGRIRNIRRLTLKSAKKSKYSKKW